MGAFFDALSHENKEAVLFRAIQHMQSVPFTGPVRETFYNGIIESLAKNGAEIPKMRKDYEIALGNQDDLALSVTDKLNASHTPSR